jgi:hypothetical protein
VDGTTGEVLDGILPVRAPDPSEIPALARLLAWAKEHDHPLGELT